jgi:hypothetical protein
MVLALHGPDFITPAAERFGCVGFAADVDKCRFSIEIQHTGSQIVMVMAFGIVAAFCSKKETFG